MNRGEFEHNGKTHTFAIDPALPPPAQLTLRMRTCPKSPVREFHLEYVTTDTGRDLAVYRVQNAAPV